MKNLKSHRTVYAKVCRGHGGWKGEGRREGRGEGVTDGKEGEMGGRDEREWLEGRVRRGREGRRKG